ncbi:hypothetical protein E2562_011892 [Oryza meyeriana var. granulata]|uniref:Uncharacterized protein n=1 Tax=Oryza meyeriana var. granulata TaxID=110450 RepID=A0A6G1CGT9_9ORYZ|nr:hypothetical protein E2562_011892 [Oryza meyeriana var. granulata]
MKVLDGCGNDIGNHGHSVAIANGCHVDHPPQFYKLDFPKYDNHCNPMSFLNRSYAERFLELLSHAGQSGAKL